MRAGQNGLTLIELLVTVAVLSILLSIGVPSFTNFFQNTRSTTQASELVTSLNLARSEAVRRGACVQMCSSASGTACGGTWTNGWVVQVPGGEVLRVQQAPRANAVINQAGGTANIISFGPLGDMRGAVCANEAPNAAVLTSRFNGCTGDQARQIAVATSGRISSRRVACP